MKITRTNLRTLIQEAISDRIQAVVDKKNKELKDDFKKKVSKPFSGSLTKKEKKEY
jgi:hypothetical protein